MKERKSNKKLLILFLVIIVMLLSIFIILIFKDKKDVHEEKITSTTTTTTKVSLEENNDYLIIQSKISKTGINVTLSQKTLNDSCNLLIDNKKIDIDSQYCFEGQLDLYDNFIIIISYSGNLPITHDVLILDYNGKKLTSANNMIVDKNDYINRINDFYHLYYIDNIEVDNNKIKYNIEYHNDWCALQEGYDEGLVDNCGITKIKCDDLKELGENINYTAIYEIELINDEFTVPEIISSIKLKDTDVYKKAINECE